MKILVVRFRQIGDAILSSVICNSLRASFPDAQIDYVLYEGIESIFENHSAINNLIVINKVERKNIFKYLKKVWKVTREEYDIVIDIMSTPKSEAFTLFSTKAKYKIGRKKKNRGFTYTHSIPEPTDIKDKCWKFLRMLQPLEKEYSIKYDAIPRIEISDLEQKMMREKMEKAGVNFLKPIFAWAINSRRPEKVYPIENMKRFIQKVLEKYDCQIIFYYSPEEKAFAKRVHEELENDSRIFSNIQTKSIRELAMLLKNCQMFVGNEGGPRHLAQSVGLPTLSIWRDGGDPESWIPNKNEYNVSIEPRDIGAENFESLTHEERYNLITPDILFGEFEKMYKKLKD
jgi:heptosyltransferase-2